jgi:hypothetical protein
MAQFKDKAKSQKILTHKIQKEKDLIKAWKKHNISESKISRMEDRQARHEAKKVEVDAS